MGMVDGSVILDMISSVLTQVMLCPWFARMYSTPSSLTIVKLQQKQKGTRQQS
jgi:hypothetical protein